MYRQSTKHQVWKLKRLISLALLFLLVSSCGPGGSTQTPDFTLSVGDVTIAKLLSGAATGQATVSINRTGGFSNAVNLSVTGAPAGVTTSFSDASPAGNSSTLNLNVADTTVSGPYTLTVTGTASSASKTDTFTLTISDAPPPATITVSGKVTDIFGGPLGSIAVKIGTQVANTNAQGQFSIANVTTPYDVKVVQGPRGYLFKGLTRSDPNLQLIDFGAFLGTKTATIDGLLSGGAGFPNPANHRTAVTFGAPEGFGSTILGPAGGPAYTIDAEWSGSDVLSGNLHTLQWEFDGSDVPISYKGYATKAQSLTDGGTINSPVSDLALSAGVAQADLTGNVAVPAGYTLNQNRHYVDWGINQAAFLFSNTATSFSYKTPNVGNTITIASAANNPAVGSSFASKTGIAPNATTVSLNLPEASALTLPIDTATGITTSTSFDWTAFNGGVHIAFFSGPGRQYYVITQANSTTIPDFSPEGLGLPAGANFNWQVVGMAPFASVDAATGPTGPLTDLFKTAVFALPPESDGSYMVSLTRTFTTAP